MTQKEIIHPERRYMERALEIAKYGECNVSPNPMVGAVIVAPDGRIIGEGWHRKYGQPHAEVNAVASVKPCDRHLIPSSTIYVTLEPCSHYGKTPPCSKLLIEQGFRRVVAGIADPFKEVSGRGINMLREAGIEVITPFMEDECRMINKRFITAHTLKRPFIQLKWAQSSDGFIAPENGNVTLSNPLSMVEMHRQRALADAILAGTDTIRIDNPSLTNRLWSGNTPCPVIFASDRIPEDAKVLKNDPIILDKSLSLQENMKILYSRHKITSLMVEGGAKMLESFIQAGLFDEIRVEISTINLEAGVSAPLIPEGVRLTDSRKVRENMILTYEAKLINLETGKSPDEKNI